MPNPLKQKGLFNKGGWHLLAVRLSCLELQVVGRIKDGPLLLRKILKARQTDVLCFAETIVAAFLQLAMFSATRLVHSLSRSVQIREVGQSQVS